MVKVCHHCVQVHLQYCLVNFLFQLLGNVVKAKLPCALYKNYLVAKCAKHFRLHKLLHVGKEIFLVYANLACVFLQLWSYADKFFHASFLCQLAHCSIEL